MHIQRTISAVCLPLSFLTWGCVSTSTWDIDTSTARDFQWDGKMRITEQTITEVGPFLNLQSRTSVRSFELVGEHGRNIVVRPTGQAAEEHPIARVETPGEVEHSVTRLLAMSLEGSGSAEAGTLASSQPGTPEERTAEAQREGQRIVRLLETQQDLRERRYTQLTTSEAVAAAASMSRSTCTVFELGEECTMKAWLDNSGPPSLCATVYDKDGNVLHEYRPVDLAVHKTSSQP